MIKEKIFLKQPISFKEKIFIYPPSINEVVFTDNFQKYLKILTYSKEEVEDEYVKENNIDKFPTPLEFLLINCYNSQEYYNLVKEAFNFFCHCEILNVYEYKKILVTKNLAEDINSVNSIEELFFLDESNFFDFQNLIRNSVGQNSIELPDEDEDPRIRRIKAKARYRDRIKAKKGMGLSLSTMLAAICCMNLGLNPLNIGEISYASAIMLMSTYQEKEKYESDMAWLRAGADSKKIKTKYWIRNLE